MFRKRYRLICLIDNAFTENSTFHSRYVIEYRHWYSIIWWGYKSYSNNELILAKKRLNYLITNTLIEKKVIC